MRETYCAVCILERGVGMARTVGIGQLEDKFVLGYTTVQKLKE